MQNADCVPRIQLLLISVNQWSNRVAGNDVILKQGAGPVDCTAFGFDWTMSVPSILEPIKQHLQRHRLQFDTNPLWRLVFEGLVADSMVEPFELLLKVRQGMSSYELR